MIVIKSIKALITLKLLRANRLCGVSGKNKNPIMKINGKNMNTYGTVP